jgi:hypothetical protein
MALPLLFNRYRSSVHWHRSPWGSPLRPPRTRRRQGTYPGLSVLLQRSMKIFERSMAPCCMGRRSFTVGNSSFSFFKIQEGPVAPAELPPTLLTQREKLKQARLQRSFGLPHSLRFIHAAVFPHPPHHRRHAPRYIPLGIPRRNPSFQPPLVLPGKWIGRIILAHHH